MRFWISNEEGCVKLDFLSLHVVHWLIDEFVIDGLVGYLRKTPQGQSRLSPFDLCTSSIINILEVSTVIALQNLHLDIYKRVHTKCCCWWSSQRRKFGVHSMPLYSKLCPTWSVSYESHKVVPLVHIGLELIMKTSYTWVYQICLFVLGKHIRAVRAFFQPFWSYGDNIGAKHGMFNAGRCFPASRIEMHKDESLLNAPLNF
jgi:hypothetical protein